MRLWQNWRKSRWQIPIAFGIGVCLLIAIRPLWQQLTDVWHSLLLPTIITYQNWLGEVGQSVWVLPFLAFLGGVIVSLTPCVVALLPVYLTYIGTLEPQSRREALSNSLFFVAGACSLFAILGALAGLTNAILLAWRSQIYLAIGVGILLAGLKQLGILKLGNLPRLTALAWLGHPFWVGVSFATVISPCGAGIAVATVLAAGGTGSPLGGAMVMICYGLGYTLVIFLASLGVGLAKQARKFIPYSEKVLHVAGVILTIGGLFYIYQGAMGLLFPAPSSSGIE
ncbi:MAG: cytochrome c biogenesis CcdA family protein [Pseudanabaenaceae cyanobacterium SKYGB_i_bin29]|nr:cytochrome c biogenesis CcdA family protein [Pseudanabaenaceae cyanobacterium SKYG29]MDW8420930.1 cytochrome c biogenesis CcdA family protein [Pseudanabaenaceae cyanobacterium SKYGB_i_bin29]